MRLRRPTLLDASTVAVLAWTSHAHWELAGQLGMPTVLRAFLPLAVDAYYLEALRERRDRLPAIGLAVVSIAGAHAATQLHLQQYPGVRAGIAAALAVVLALTLWRGHELRHAGTTDRSLATDEAHRWRARWRALADTVRRHRAALERMANQLVEVQQLADARETALAAVRRELAEALATRAANDGEHGGDVDPDSGESGGDVPGDGVATLAAQLAAGQWRGTWRDLQTQRPELSDRQAQRALADARKAAARHGLRVAGGAR